LALAGQIARDLRDPEAARAQPPHHAAAVQTSAVLAEVVPLVGSAAASSRLGELPQMDAGRTVVGCEEDVAVDADDLVGGVSEHPLRAGVPRIDHDVLCRREDR